MNWIPCAKRMPDDEEWRPVVGWEGCYAVSSAGRVMSLPRVVHRSDGSVQTFKRRILRLMVSSNGYHSVRLSDSSNGRRLLSRVHRLVAIAFIPNPGRLPEVNHKDGVKRNNVTSNLEWVTSRGNREHAWRIGLRTREHLPIMRGEQNGRSLYTQDLVLAVRRCRHSMTISEQAKSFGLSKATIKHLRDERKWSHLNTVPEPPA